MLIVTLLSLLSSSFFPLFFFIDTATTEIYTLSLHDALPISDWADANARCITIHLDGAGDPDRAEDGTLLLDRSEEHTSELQSQFHLVCRLLLEKKKKSTTSV